MPGVKSARVRIVNRTPSASPAAAPPVAVQRKASAPAAHAHVVQRSAARSDAGAPVAVRAPGRAAHLQPSLRVSSPHDPAEREADSIARRIVSMSAPEPGPAVAAPPRAPSSAQPSAGAGAAATPRAWRSPYLARFAAVGPLPGRRLLQRKLEGTPDVSSNVEADIRASAASGEPLPLSVRRFMEPRFRADFSGVRVHTGERAAALNRQLGARAFTVGGRIFFGRGQYRPESPDGRELIAHELTHTVQQGAVAQHTAPAAPPAPVPPVQPAAGVGSQPVQRAADVTVTSRAPQGVQRFGVSDALDYIAERAYLIPGFRMLTILLGVNPVNMSRVERTPANILRAVIEFIPGGALITRALDSYGVFDRVGGWIQQQIDSLGMTGRMFRDALDRFLDSLSWRDIFRLGDVWDRARRIFSEPIGRIIGFLRGLAAGILRFIKDAILRPLAGLAQNTRGYDLLKAVLGRDPITGDPYPRNAATLIGGFMKLIGQEEVWHNIQRAHAAARAWAWFQGALAGLLGFVRSVPGIFLQAVQSLTIEDIVVLPRAFARVGRVFLDVAGRFFSWAGRQVFSLLQIIFAVLAPRAMVYLRRAAGAFRLIIANPVHFIGNLVRAGVLGFRQFARNFLAHLRASLIAWLTGTLAGANVYIPQAFTLREIIKFVLSILGLTWQNIRQKLVRVIGERAVHALETGFELVRTLVTQGPAAAWEKIKEGLSNLREMVMEQILTFVRERIVQAAITRLITSLNPAGAFIQAVIAIYNTIMFFVERLRQIAQVAVSFINSISAIAHGALAAAANRVEHTMEGLLTLVISFLARLVGLGRVSDAVKNVINRIRAPIDRALDRVVDWIVTMARRAGRFLMGGARGAAPAPAAARATAAPGAAPGTTVVAEPFAMRGHSHTLTVTATARGVQVVMASNGAGDLSGKIERLKAQIQHDDPRIRDFIIRALDGIQNRLNDYNQLLAAYARRLGVEGQGPVPTPPADFVREYTHGLVGEIVQLATAFGFEDLVARTFVPIPLPARRFIPEPVKSQIRGLLYERGSAWTSVRDGVRRSVTAAIDREVQTRIVAARAAGDLGGAAAAMADMKARGKVLDDASLAHFVAGQSYVAPRSREYAVDHDPSLAEHWVSGGGNRTSDAERRQVVEGRRYSTLDLVTRRFNSRKGSRNLAGEPQRFKRHAWITPPFTSEIGKDANGGANNEDLITLANHSLTYPDGTPFLPS